MVIDPNIRKIENKQESLKGLKDNIVNYPYVKNSYRKIDLNELIRWITKHAKAQTLKKV